MHIVFICLMRLKNIEFGCKFTHISAIMSIFALFIKLNI